MLKCIDIRLHNENCITALFHGIKIPRKGLELESNETDFSEEDDKLAQLAIERRFKELKK